MPSAACPSAPDQRREHACAASWATSGDAPASRSSSTVSERLEYRGYDSAGITLLEADGLETVRAVGNLDALFAAVGDGASPATVGLGHTRWATHGSVSEENAHPHDDCTGRVSVVLNGIIENYKELRAALTARGHRLTSETDAEVVVHLVEEHAGEGLAAAVRAAIPRLEGHFAFCAVLGRRARPRGRHAP